MFQLAIELAEKIKNNSKHLIASDEEELLYKGAMLFFFSKAYKSYQAIKTLWENGFAEDAFVLARTIFEIALQARYMTKEPRTRARLFFEHDPVERYRYYEGLKKLGDTELIQTIESRTEELSELKQQHDILKDKYPKGKGWWGKTIRQLAEQSGREMERRYIAIYWMQSNFVHSGVSSAKVYIVEKDKNMLVNLYPSGAGDPMIPEEASLYFLDVIRLTAEALDIDIHEDFHSACSEITELIRTSHDSQT